MNGRTNRTWICPQCRRVYGEAEKIVSAHQSQPALGDDAAYSFYRCPQCAATIRHTEVPDAQYVDRAVIEERPQAQAAIDEAMGLVESAFGYKPGLLRGLGGYQAIVNEIDRQAGIIRGGGGEVEAVTVTQAVYDALLAAINHSDAHQPISEDERAERETFWSKPAALSRIQVSGAGMVPLRVTEDPEADQYGGVLLYGKGLPVQDLN